MPGPTTRRRWKLTLAQAYAGSLALHAALALPFVLHERATPPLEPSTLAIELQGVVADSQSEQKVQQQTRGETKQKETATPKPAAAEAAPEQEPPKEQTDNGDLPPPPRQASTSSPPAANQTSGSPGANDVTGAEEQKAAQRIRDRIAETLEYVKRLSKKVQANLVYPEEGRQAGLRGAPKVSFAILANGQISPETLKIVESSGHPKLDASALKTVRSAAPFDPPPRAMTIAIAVDFGPQH